MNILRKLFSTLRVPGGYADNTAAFRPVAVALVVLFALAGAAFAEEPTTKTLPLPYANLNGYTTDLITINPTGDTIFVKRPCPDNQSSCPPITDAFPGYSVRRSHIWPGSGTDYADVVIDSRMRSYVEAKTHYGTIANLPPLNLYTETVRFYDFPNPGEFEGYIWLAVPRGQEKTFVTVHDEATQETKSYEMGRGAIVLDVKGPTVRIYLGSAPGHPKLPAPSGLYAFAFTVHDLTGAITPHIVE